MLTAGADSQLCRRWYGRKQLRWQQQLEGVLGTIGNTPLIRIRSLSEATGCQVGQDSHIHLLYSPGATQLLHAPSSFGSKHGPQNPISCSVQWPAPLLTPSPTLVPHPLVYMHHISRSQSTPTLTSAPCPATWPPQILATAAHDNQPPPSPPSPAPPLCPTPRSWPRRSSSTRGAAPGGSS
jgi:hypothetical protein